MQTMKSSLLILICMALLGACGLRGPLYLPSEEPGSKPSAEQDSTPATDEEEEEKDAEKNPVSG